MKPLQRAGNRRYYRPADVVLAQRIHRLLNEDGYTIRGVQQLLAGRAAEEDTQLPAPSFESLPAMLHPAARDELRRIRGALARALADAEA